MLHISICDDEIVAVEKMRKIVGKVLEQEQLLANVGTFENGEEFLNQYIIRDDELVILDLDMPIKSGIDVIQELEKIQRNEVVILVTAYDNLAIQSFSYGPFQIIRKERLEEDLPKAVSRFLKMRQRKQEVLEFQEKLYIQKCLILYILKNVNIMFMCICGIKPFFVYGKICRILKKNWQGKDL